MKPFDALSHFNLADAETTSYGHGRIHATYHVHSGTEEFILQKIAAQFEPAMADIEKVTTHLSRKGILAPRLVRTKEQHLSVPDGEVFWRLMTYIPGVTIETTPTIAEAESGARFIAQFQEALLDYDEPFAYHIPNFYDTEAIMEKLITTDSMNTGTEKYDACHPIAITIAERMRALGGFISTPKRVLHGDLRFNNIRFNESGVAISLIDLDTLGRYPLPIEIGNMLRSWCSSRQTTRPTLTFDTWIAALKGYRSAAKFVTDEEWQAIPHGFAQVTLELAARYLTDAYEETYFVHDAKTYPSLYEQNLDRAQFCLAIHEEFELNRSSLAALHSD